MTKRELIDTWTEQRYVRRDKEGGFKESVDVGKSLAAESPGEFKDQGWTRRK